MKTKVLFVIPYPKGVAPSQRFRFEHYYDLLDREENLEYNVVPFYSARLWDILYTEGQFFRKIRLIVWAFFKRLFLLFSLARYNTIFVHREATALGPPWFEYLAVVVFRKRLIYDFDDAIWLPNTSTQNRIARHLKWHSKVETICRYATQVICGNEYLAAYAQQFNSNVAVIPTVVDTENIHNKTKIHSEKDTIVIGWTGSHSTLKYLEIIVPVLKGLEQKYNIEFQVIANQNPNLDLVGFKFIKWNKTTEIDDLLAFDIGVMPLLEDKWSNGKCGFKAIQYLSLGIPAIVSDVGVNAKIVQHGKSGFVCNCIADWEHALETLIVDVAKRKEYGGNGKQLIIKGYSVISSYILFEKIMILNKNVKYIK